MEKGLDAEDVCVKHMKKEREVKITSNSIRTELASYRDKPESCIFEYIWNAFDAGATEIKLNFDIPKEGLGYIDHFEIADNGKGWKFDEDKNTDTFLSSTKETLRDKNKSLPKGRFGRGRFAFIWVADGIDVYSGDNKISLNHETTFSQESSETHQEGTLVNFLNPKEDLVTILLDTEKFKRKVILEFGWLILQNPKFKIFINSEVVDPHENVREEAKYTRIDFSEEVASVVSDKFFVEIVLWKEKPAEWSNYYFLNEQRNEIFKSGTGLNKKGDGFWHAVYVGSDIFDDRDITDEDSPNQQFDFGGKDKRKIKGRIKREIVAKLIQLRKPYLEVESTRLIEKLEEDGLMPKLDDYGVFDTESYSELLKTIYVISPSLFVSKSDAEKKFICAIFAGLLSTQDDQLIQVILEQLQELTEDEKNDLKNILSRTTLSNMVKTIKEIDHRLEVIDKLKVLISDYEPETLEVRHLQKILDDNFWIFGEQFRLFSSTEGALRTVLLKYAAEILGIEDPKLDTHPNGEVDLFLTKTECGSGIQRNIIVELKRASKKLLRDVEYRQIETYKDRILEQSMANGTTQYWEFYLIGKDYDSGIEGYIHSSKNYGEIERGLSFCDKDGRVKIYVRKWSDVLESEWGNKMKYLKEKLVMKSESAGVSPEEITHTLIESKEKQGD